MQFNNLVVAARFFLVIAGELAVLFVAVSFLIGLLQQYVPEEKIRRVLGGTRHRLINNILGAGFGALTPFCSCSTIPITLGLINGGAQFGSAMSFLIASPLLNPVIISLLVIMLGLKTTVIYVSIIFPAAVLTGYVWEKMGLEKEVKNVMVQRGCCDTETAATGQFKYTRLASAFSGAWSLFIGMLPWLLVGAAIGAFIYGFIPEDLVVKIAGPGNPLAIPLAALVGIPMYVRAETMLPISNVLLSKGMGIGAVMALLIGGSGASIPELSLLTAIFKKKLVAAFIITVLFWATFAGFLFTLLT